MRFLATSASRLAFLLLGAHSVSAFDYNLTGTGEISLTDIETEISDIQTIFVGEPVAVTVVGLEWTQNDENIPGDILYWETYVGESVQAQGEFDLTTLPNRELPHSLDVGNVTIPSSGRHEITVTLFITEDNEVSASAEFEAYQAGVAIVPLLIVLVLAMVTQMVEVSLVSAVFVGACMVTGNITDGFKRTLDDYILNALASVDHAYVYLFTLFLSGMVGMMEKSGGMIGFTHKVGQYAKTPRAGQFATFAIGCAIFFDDYTNTLLAGQSMRPLTDLLFISREKLSFIVDATSAPIASLSPISSWVGFEVGLIQQQIDRLILLHGEENLTIHTSALSVFFESVKYRYYPIFMIFLIPLLIFAQRDFGPMLIAERKTQVYERIDGGDGHGKGDKKGEDGETKNENEPRPDTPNKAWNMIVPISLLVFLIFYLLVKTGDDGTGTQSFSQKIEGSDSYSALLWGTMGATILTQLFYMVQLVQSGGIVLPTWSVLQSLFGLASASHENQFEKDISNEITAAENESSSNDSTTSGSRARPLMSFYESVESFLFGTSRIFPALIVLTLAWASGSIMIAVGADRLFARWITQGVSAQAMPTLSFLISIFMALSTGTSWGTMTILFPLLCVPTYEVANGDATIFYATVAGILSGSVAGDHMSPISDTTVLSALASDCDLLKHVVTQAPYALIVVVLSIFFGTIPIGWGAWPNIVGILLGMVAIGFVVYGLCAPVVSDSGKFDIMTELCLCVKKDTSLYDLKEDTINKSQEKQRDSLVSTADASFVENHGSDDDEDALIKGKSSNDLERDDVLPRPAFSELSV